MSRKTTVAILAIWLTSAAITGAQDVPASNPAPVARDALEKIFAEASTPYKVGVVIPTADGKLLDCPCVFRDPAGADKWWMMYVEQTPKVGYETRLAESADLLTWKQAGVIMPFADDGWDQWQACGSMALIDTEWGGSMKPEKFDGKYWMSYFGGNKKGYEVDPLSLGVAFTDSIEPNRPWTRYEHNPVMAGSDPTARSWERTTIFKTSVIHDPQKRLGFPFLVYYNARTQPSLEAIGMAASSDMVHWSRIPEGQDEPLLQSADKTGHGISGDPQLVRMTVDGRETWVMFYFGHRWRPGAFDTFAASYDLVHWTKWDGADLIAPGKTFDKTFAHKPWLLKHEGVVYHFYCSVGEGGRQIALATSKDLTSKSAPSAPAASP